MNTLNLGQTDNTNTSTCVETLLGSFTPQTCEIASHLRSLMRSLVPEVIETAYPTWNAISYTHPFCGYLCAIFLHKDSVKICFEFGVLLPDPDGVLEGNDKQLRYVVIRHKDSIPCVAIKRLINTLLNLPTTYKLKRMYSVNQSSDAQESCYAMGNH